MNMMSNTNDVTTAWEEQRRSWNTFLGVMLDNQALYDIDNITKFELVQRYEEGCDIEEATSRWKEVVEQGGDREEFLNSLATLEKRPDWPYHEPNALADIMSARPASQHSYAIAGDLDDKILGAWLGRCGGCLLGKPVEGWSYEDIAEYLRAAGEWPLTQYFPWLDPSPVKTPLHSSAKDSTRGHIECMARDDDVDYMLMALAVLEGHSMAYKSEDVGKEWIERFPYGMVYTAEKIAYRNLVNGLQPPLTATYGNPFREWIGAQIRADVFGYVKAGDPEAAARLSYNDAALSHVKNGIYGELFAAAMVAGAFGTGDPVEALRAGMSQIPETSRLYEALQFTVSLQAQHSDWRDAHAVVMEAYGHYHRVHTINNACFVALGLLYGGNDYGRSISIAVECGMDTDCNGATVGSVIGAIHGAQALPDEWVSPLNNRVRSMVAGFDNSDISDLAERTTRLVVPC
jgi:ADP-ribosylglycohydrolase